MFDEEENLVLVVRIDSKGLGILDGYRRYSGRYSSAPDQIEAIHINRTIPLDLIFLLT